MALQQPGWSLKALARRFQDPLHFSLGAIGSYVADARSGKYHQAVVYMVHEALAEGRCRASIIHDLALAVEGLLLKHGKGGGRDQRQFLQQRLANAAIDIFFSVAVHFAHEWEIERAGKRRAATPELDCARVIPCRNAACAAERASAEEPIRMRG